LADIASFAAKAGNMVLPVSGTNVPLLAAN
jgi:hypothetical protein